MYESLSGLSNMVPMSARLRTVGDTQAQGPMEVNLRFPGQYYDAETGQHQNWHRSYDPTSGRYGQPDPAGIGDGLNTYSYVSGDPINYFDFTGLAKRACTKRVFLILRGAVLASCKVPTSCSASDGCNIIRLKIATKKFSIQAQQALSTVCFPGDQTHKQRIQDERRGITRCEEFKKKACTECDQ